MAEGVKVASIYAELGFDVDSVKLNDVVQAIGKLNFNSVLAALGVAGLVDGLKNIMEIGQGLTEPLYKFNAETGLSAQRMQQWTEYAQKLGVSGDVISSSLSGLQKKMAAMKFGDTSLLSGIYLLQQAGAKINENDLNDPFSFLDKATVGLQKIKPELRTYVAGLLGLNEQVLLLKNGFQGADNMPSPTPEQINNIRNYTSAWTGFAIIARQLATDIASNLSPGLTELGKDLEAWGVSLHSVKEYILPVTEAVWGLYVAIMALSTGNPLGLLITALVEVALHADQIGKAFQDIYNWTHKIFGEEGKKEGLRRKQNINASVDSFFHKNFGFNTPGSIYAQQGNNSGKHEVNQHNAITIVANDIKDIEHKFLAFMEKTIAKSFYQNSQNY